MTHITSKHFTSHLTLMAFLLPTYIHTYIHTITIVNKGDTHTHTFNLNGILLGEILNEKAFNDNKKRWHHHKF